MTIRIVGGLPEWQAPITVRELPSPPGHASVYPFGSAGPIKIAEISSGFQ